ncbi:hypothetical protein NMG60_11032267 [Bertholletia excelsa]
MPNSLHDTVEQDHSSGRKVLNIKVSNVRFIGLSIPKPKLKIKMRDLLRRDLNLGDERKKTRANPRNLLPRKVGPAMSCVFAGKKLPQKSSIGARDDGLTSNGDVLRGNGKTQDLSCEQSKNITGSSINLEEKVQSKSALFFSGILGRNGLGFNLRRKTSKPFDGTIDSSKLTMSEPEEEEGNGEEGGGEELCKKRILMGEKCRPLNLSGALHYDQNGVLLPEEVHPGD